MPQLADPNHFAAGATLMSDDPDLNDIDWSDCPFVQYDPNYCGGVLVLRAHPRLPVEALIYNHLDGETIEDVAYMFEVDLEQTRAIVQYYLDRAI